MGTGGDPMKQLIAIVIAGIVLIFFIAAAGVPDWEHASAGPASAQFGAFRFCFSSPTQNCYTIYPDCSVHGSACDSQPGGCGSVQSSSCNQLRAVEGFLILALLLDAVVLILMCVVRFSGKEISPIAIHALLGIICIFTIISFSIFINDLDPPPGIPAGFTWKLGAGPGLMIVAWLLSMGNIPLWHLATKGATA